MTELAHFVREVDMVPCSLGGRQNPNPLGDPGEGGWERPEVQWRLRVPSSALLPGDIVVVEPGKAAFDAVLLSGECVVDETVLTGEQQRSKGGGEVRGLLPPWRHLSSLLCMRL